LSKKIFSFFILFILLISTANVSVKANETFTDLGSVPWAKEAIYYLHERGIISGYGNGQFGPNDKITREQAALMLVKELYPNEKSDTQLNFPDVELNSLYYNAIAVAVDHGLFVGYPDGTFKPQDPITRAATTKILAVAYNLTGSNADFTDMDDAPWATDYINALASNNIVSGYSDNTFRPKNTITRAEFSVAFARTLEPSFRSSPTIPEVAWEGKWTNQFGYVAISNETSNSFDFQINVAMGDHVGDIDGTASIQGRTAVYTEYIDAFEGLFDDPTCRVTFTHSGDSIKVKETAACSYWHGMAATFDGTYAKSTEPETQLEKEPNNTLDKIQQLELNKKLVAEFNEGDIDIYQFTLEEKSNVKFDISQEYPLAKVAFFDQNQEFIGYVVSLNDSQYSYQNLTPGTYFIQVMKGSSMVAPSYSYEMEINSEKVQ
jgi:hypothetical protein